MIATLELRLVEDAVEGVLRAMSLHLPERRKVSGVELNDLCRAATAALELILTRQDADAET